jgi:formylglycine-generating enzyme required for sulfatase activity
VCRGGSWDGVASYCRSALRYWYVPSFRLDYYGLRVSLSLSRIPKSPEADSK